MERTEKDNRTLIEFWSKALTLSEEDKESTNAIDPDSWKEMAPSEKLFRAAQELGSCKKVLDYGCGNAWASIIAAKSGCSDVDAVDVAQGGAEAASFYAGLFGVSDRIRVSYIDPAWLSTVAPGSYDGIICSNVLDVVPPETAREIAAGLARAAAPGARVAIGLNFYMSPERAAERGIVLEDGNRLYVDGVLRMVSRSDEQWSDFFSEWFRVESLEHFAWPGEKAETRRLFRLCR